MDSTTAAIATNNITTITTTTMVPEEERNEYLDQLQADTNITMIPAMVFLIVLAVTGLIGNSLVLFVYSQKFTRTTTRIFILTIASFDLVANVIAIPGEIYDMHHIWNFNNPPLCRARLFFSAFATVSSAMILLAVAVVRYRMVCKPYGWQVTPKHARIVSVIITSVGLVLAIPYAVINGRQTKETPRTGIHGYECTTDDSFVDTIWPVLNTAFFLILFVSCCVPLTVLYILIGVKAWKHSRIHGVSTASLATNRTTLTSVSTAHNKNSDSISAEQRRDSLLPNHESSPAYQRQLSTPSATKSTTLKKWRSAESIGCSSVDFGSIADVMEEYNSDPGPEQYTVRILHDRVVIHTPMMGEFIVPLDQASDGDVNLFGHLVSELEDEQANQDLHAKVISIDGAEHEESKDNEEDGGNDGFDNMAFACGDEEVDEKLAPLETMEMVKFKELEHTDDNDRSVGVLQDTENKGGEIESQKINVATTNTITNPNSPTAPSRRKRNVALREDTEIDEKTKNKHEQESKFENEPSACDGDTKNATDETNDQTDDEKDLMSALKWVDIIYCPEKLQSIDTEPDKTTVAGPNGDTPISYRISPTNNVLKKAEWLRAIIVEAVQKAKSKNRGPGTKDDAEDIKTQEHSADESQNTPNGQDNENIREPLEQPIEAKISTDDDHNKHETPRAIARLKRLVSKATSGQRVSSSTSVVRRRPLTKTTAMLIIISAIFAVGYLPHLALMFFKFTSPEKFAALTMVELSFYNLFLRSYFLNCAANPIIYSLCDINFRRECLGLFRCKSCRRH